MAISEPNATKPMKLGSEEVCFILSGDSAYACCLYIVDLNEKQCKYKEYLEPCIRLSIDFPRNPAYAILNSVLYVFGGYDEDWTSGSRTFDLTSCFEKRDPIGVSCVSSWDSLTLIPSMVSKKCQPCAVVIGDQICVFSLSITRDVKNFELYDPKDGKWSVLPELPFTDEVKVKYYAVENDNLFIRTCFRSYSIDTKGPRQWIPCELPEVNGYPDGYGLSPPDGSGFAKKGNVLISPYLDVADIAKTDEVPYSFREPHLGNLPILFDGFIPKSEAIVLLDKHGLRTCVVEGGGYGANLYGNRYNPHVGLTLVRFSERPWEDDNMLINTRLYNLGHEFFNDNVFVKGIYPLSSSQSTGGGRGLE